MEGTGGDPGDGSTGGSKPIKHTHFSEEDVVNHEGHILKEGDTHFEVSGMNILQGKSGVPEEMKEGSGDEETDQHIKEAESNKEKNEHIDP